MSDRQSEHSQFGELSESYVVYCWEHEEDHYLYNFHYYNGNWSIACHVLVSVEFMFGGKISKTSLILGS